MKSAKSLSKRREFIQSCFAQEFTHRNVAEITEAVGGNVSVAVARGDGPSSRVSAEIRRRELSP